MSGGSTKDLNERVVNMDYLVQEQQLRDFAKSKDLFVKKDSKTSLWSVFDKQQGKVAKMVATGLTFEEAYDFVNKYDW